MKYGLWNENYYYYWKKLKQTYAITLQKCWLLLKKHIDSKTIKLIKTKNIILRIYFQVSEVRFSYISRINCVFQLLFSLMIITSKYVFHQEIRIRAADCWWNWGQSWPCQYWQLSADFHLSVNLPDWSGEMPYLLRL